MDIIMPCVKKSATSSDSKPPSAAMKSEIQNFLAVS